MAAKNNLKLFLLVAAASLLSAVNSADSNLIDQVCSTHLDGKFCRDQLSSASFTDLQDLGNVSIDLTRARATNTTYIKALLSNETTAQAKAVLQDCVSHYGSAAESIEESRASLVAKDYWKMNSYASAASTYAGTCEDGFVDVKLASPLTSQNKALQNSAQIVEIVANILGGRA